MFFTFLGRFSDFFGIYHILYINTLLEGFIFHFVPLGTKCIDTSRVHSTRDVSHISPSAKHEGLYEIYPES